MKSEELTVAEGDQGRLCCRVIRKIADIDE